MESSVAVEIESSEARSEGVGEKRPLTEYGDVVMEELPSPPKRIKGGNGRSLVSDVKKVAEMVLVLAAMGKMRGGKGPTEAEKELMAEARNRLANVCEGFAPKEVFPRDAFGGVIEDLGLNKLKEQRLGYRPPKVSIAEKLLLSKKKMEKAEDFSLPSTPHASQRPQGSSGAVIEGRNASHPVQMSQLAKPGHIYITSGSFQSASPLGHVNAANHSSSPYQLPTSEIRPVVSNALPSSHLGSAAMPRVDRPHLRTDVRSNGSLVPSQIQANYPANSIMRTPTWSVQPQGVSSAKVGSENKAHASMSLKVEGGADAKPGLAASRTVISGPPSQATNYAPPLGNTHAEIGKIVQKLLQTQVSDRPSWNPPSRDYMNKPLTCQVCMSTVTEIDTILICDACEKGYHLKCLQTSSQKGIPRGEWHCAKCLSLSNGKPLPPKYGRVMRNISTGKVSSSAAAPSTPSNKIAASDEKVDLAKVTMNGNVSKQNVLAGFVEINSGPQAPGSQSKVVIENNFGPEAPGSQGEDAQGIQENDGVSSKSKAEEQIPFGTHPNNSVKPLPPPPLSSMNSSFEQTGDDGKVEPKPNSSPMLEKTLNHLDESRVMVSAHDRNFMPPANETTPPKQLLEDHIDDPKESQPDRTSSDPNQLKEHADNSNQLKGQEVVLDNTSETNAGTEVVNKDRSSSDGLHAVNWVGDQIHVLDGKIYYASCNINGHVYKANDHALVRFKGDKLVPSKLQAMWENKNTGTQWVTVNRCYFPGDLPESVGRPCGLENSEVYESTSGTTLMAGLLVGPCEVLPPREFAEESERRTRAGMQPNGFSPPLFLCKWIYDEAKGLFRDVSC